MSASKFEFVLHITNHHQEHKDRPCVFFLFLQNARREAEYETKGSLKLSHADILHSVAWCRQVMGDDLCDNIPGPGMFGCSSVDTFLTHAMSNNLLTFYHLTEMQSTWMEEV